MNDLSKKDLLELRISGYPNYQGQVRALTNSGSDPDSNQGKQVGDNQNTDSQKSEGDSKRGRKRKSHAPEPWTVPIKICEPFVTPDIIDLSTGFDLASVPSLIRRVKELEGALTEFQDREKRYHRVLENGQSFICDLLINDYKLRKKQRFEIGVEKAKRLGSYATVRKGTQFVEIWQDGQAFKDIDEEIAENNRLKDELEKIRKAINKRKPNDKNCLGIRSPTDRVRRTRGVLEESTAHNSMMPINQSCSVEDYQRYEELYKIRLNTLKKEEIELNIEREKLEKERDLHIKNMKIFANEESSRFNHNPKLNNNRYLILDMLGRGGFSEVFKAFDLNEFKFVACKIHQLNFQWTEAKKHNFVRHAVREYKIHSTLDHPNIVKFLDVFEIDNDSFGTVMEYCDGNDLDTYLKQNKIIPERDARFIIVQVAQALRYMNELRPSIIHFDLKPGNILLLSGINAWHVKIADFGLSKTLPVEGDETSIDLTTPGAGTYWYLPPECFFTGINPTKISSKVDVWSVGIIFYQCLYGRKPFGNDLSQTNILEQNTILNATSITFPMKPIVSTEAKDFIRCCLVYNKENRMDVIQMSEMPYLKYRKPERSTLPPPLTNLKISDY